MNDPPAADRRYHRGNLRQAVLVRAEQILRVSGIDGLSLRQIARDLGVSHAAPSRHFADRQALLDALALAGFQRLGSRFDQAITTAEPSAGLHQRMDLLARTYLWFAIENPALLGLMFARKHGTTANPEISAAALGAFTTPHALIADGQQRGDIIPGDTTTIGLTAMANLQGLATFVTSGFITTDRAEQLLTNVTDQLLNGLRPR